MLSTKITGLFSTGAKIEDGIHPDRLKLALEVLETFLFEKPLIKSYHTLLGPIGNSPFQPGRQWEWSDVNLLNLQVMTQTGTTDIFIYIAYSNSIVGEKVQTQHMRTYFDKLCEQKGWPEIEPENRHLFSHVFIIRIGNLDEKRLLALLGPKPAFSYNHNYGMSSQDRRRTVELIRKEGIPEWSSATLTDGIYQFWTQQEHQLYQALHQLGKTPDAEPNEKLAKTQGDSLGLQKVEFLENETESTTIVSPDFKPSVKFVKELLDRETSFEVVTLAAAKGDVGFTLEMLGIGRPTGSYPYFRKPQKEGQPVSLDESTLLDIVPTQEQQAIFDCLDCWYPKSEGCVEKILAKLRNGQILCDRSYLFAALCPDSAYCMKHHLDQEVPHEALELIASYDKTTGTPQKGQKKYNPIVLTSDDLFYIVEKVQPTFKTYEWIFTKVKPTKQHAWAMIKALRGETSLYKTSAIAGFIEAVHKFHIESLLGQSSDSTRSSFGIPEPPPKSFTDDEIDSFFMEHNLSNWNVTPSNLGYTMTQKLYNYAICHPELQRVLLDMFQHEQKQFEKRWGYSIEEHYAKVSCLRNVKIRVEDIGMLLSFRKERPDWTTYLISHIFTLCPNIRTTRDHLKLCLMNGYKFPLYFALAQRLEKKGAELSEVKQQSIGGTESSPSIPPNVDRLTIHEISHAVDHYREKRGNHRDCTLQPLYIVNRDPAAKEMTRAYETILVKQ